VPSALGAPSLAPVCARPIGARTWRSALKGSGAAQDPDTEAIIRSVCTGESGDARVCLPAGMYMVTANATGWVGPYRPPPPLSY
jgi:hypothetical protein